MPIQEQQSTNKQHAVPQNIMDVEFKLVGELTMRQFTYIAVFAVAAYMAKLSVPQPFTWFFVVGLALTGLSLAFVPLEDRGLDEWLVNFIKAINSPTERVWKKETIIPNALAFEQNLHFVRQELITLAPTASRRKLEEYLEHQGKSKQDELDIPEEKYIKMVKEAFQEKPATQAAVTQQSRAKPKTTVATPQQLPAEEPREKKQKQVQERAAQKPPHKEEKTMPKEKPKGDKPREIQKEPAKEKEQAQMQKAKTTVQEKKQDKMAKLIRSRMKKAEINLTEGNKIKRQPSLQPVSEHSGRKFLNLTPSQGQIVLPIRGEKVLQTEEEAARKYNEKTKKLQELLQKTEEAETQKAKTQKNLQVKQIPAMVNKPNIVSGVLKNRKDETLEDVILVIKNKKGEPVRALKTDRLGHFLISTPLPNGEYEIEIDKTGKTNLSFDIIPLKVEGGLLPSLEIIGR